MCEKCASQYEEFKGIFLSEIRNDPDKVRSGKINNPAFETLIALITGEGAISLTGDEREKLVEYIVQLLFNVTVLNQHLEHIQSLLLLSGLTEAAMTDPSKVN